MPQQCRYCCLLPVIVGCYRSLLVVIGCCGSLVFVVVVSMLLFRRTSSLLLFVVCCRVERVLLESVKSMASVFGCHDGFQLRDSYWEKIGKL